jgi:hypothetical protein
MVPVSKKQTDIAEPEPEEVHKSKGKPNIATFYILGWDFLI